MLSVGNLRNDGTANFSIAETPFGALAYLPNDDPIGKALATYGEWARIEIDFLSFLISVGDTVVDVGANIGTHTVAFANFVGAGGRVLSFEPQPEIFRLLANNVRTNGFSNVEPVQAGVGNTSKAAYLKSLDYAEHDNFGGVRLNAFEESSTVEVPVVPLDSYHLPVCRLVKIDAEGMEAEVLQGMAETIERCRPIIYIECNTIEDGARTLEILKQHRYEFSLIATAAYNSQNRAGSEENFFGVARETSLLCLPSGSAIAVPPSTHACAIRKVRTVDELAVAHLAVPRFGDMSEHDRDVPYLHDKVNSLCAQLNDAAGQIKNMNSLGNSQREEAQRLKFRIKTLEKQLEKSLLAEQTIKASLFDQMSAAIASVRSDLASSLSGCEVRLRAAEERASARDAQIAHIYASTSWFVTKPIRRARRVISKILNRKV